MHLLGEASEERYFSNFAFHLDDVYEDQRELSLLSQLAKDYGYMRPSLRAAKQASRFQSMLTDSGYPLIEEIESLPGSFDIPFVYAVARQESEFEFNVVSSAKAYGMMQMIDSTANIQRANIVSPILALSSQLTEITALSSAHTIFMIF